MFTDQSIDVASKQALLRQHSAMAPKFTPTAPPNYTSINKSFRPQTAPTEHGTTNTTTVAAATNQKFFVANAPATSPKITQNIGQNRPHSSSNAAINNNNNNNTNNILFQHAASTNNHTHPFANTQQQQQYLRPKSVGFGDSVLYASNNNSRNNNNSSINHDSKLMGSSDGLEDAASPLTISTLLGRTNTKSGNNNNNNSHNDMNRVNSMSRNTLGSEGENDSSNNYSSGEQHQQQQSQPAAHSILTSPKRSQTPLSSTPAALTTSSAKNTIQAYSNYFSQKNSNNSNNNMIKMTSPPKTNLSARLTSPTSPNTNFISHESGGGGGGDLLSEDPIFRLWLKQHPDADNVMISQQKYRRTKEIADAERTERAHYLKRLQEDLSHLETFDELVARETADELDKFLSPMSVSSARSPQQQQQQQRNSSNFNSPNSLPGNNNANPKDDPAGSSASTQLQNTNTQHHHALDSKTRIQNSLHHAEAEAQKLAWLSFHGIIDETLQQQPKLNNLLSQQPLQQHLAPPTADSHNTHPTIMPITSVVSKAPAVGELATLGWYDTKGIWHMSTDRHENAATCIQCAFRCFVAKRRSRNKRRTRQRAIQKIMAAEASLEYAWIAATSVKDVHGEEGALSSEVDKTIRIMGKFAERFRAVVARRRRRIAKDREVWDETLLYAVVRIQATVRGFLVRQKMELVRNPEIAIARQIAVENKAATNIQRVARGKLTRITNERRRKAATKLQSTYRRHLCKFRAAQMRRIQRVTADAEISDFAARVLQRFMRSLVVRRLQGLKAHRRQTLLLQAVGRGFKARRESAKLFFQMVNVAAVDIQRMFRGWQARNNYVSGLVTAHKQAMEEALKQHAACIVTRAFRKAKIFSEQRNEILQTVAATEIQRMYRGYAARKHAAQLRADETEGLLLQQRENAAIIIQSSVRGFVCRSKYLRENNIISKKTKSNSANNNNNTKRNDARFDHIKNTPQTNSAASSIQKFYLHFIRRRKFRVCINQAARKIQKFLASVKCRKLLVNLAKSRNDARQQKQEESVSSEKAAASNMIKKFLKNRIDDRQALNENSASRNANSPAAKNQAAKTQREESLEKEAVDQGMNYSCVLIQKVVRGFMIRRFIRILKDLERDQRTVEYADVKGDSSWPCGVTSYEAACSLQRYYMKHHVISGAQQGN